MHKLPGEFFLKLKVTKLATYSIVSLDELKQLAS
jgi:hypothetical protein